MGRFGIGARVRDTDGDEGVIVDKRKGERATRPRHPHPLLAAPKKSKSPLRSAIG